MGKSWRRVVCVGLAIALVACSGSPSPDEGGGCAELVACCQTLVEVAQPECLAEAEGGDASTCRLRLDGLMAARYCLPGSPDCQELAACCPSLENDAERDSCEARAEEGVNQTCLAALGIVRAGGSCVEPAGG